MPNDSTLEHETPFDSDHMIVVFVIKGMSLQIKTDPFGVFLFFTPCVERPFQMLGLNFLGDNILAGCTFRPTEW